jgi:hypothetical protein
MSCGCQKRTASNGATACSSCINTLEASIKGAKLAASKPNQLGPLGPNRYVK